MAAKEKPCALWLGDCEKQHIENGFGNNNFFQRAVVHTFLIFFVYLRIAKLKKGGIMATMAVTKTLAKTNETAWKNKKAEDLAYLDWFVNTRPKNIPVTDDEIQEMVDEVRYGSK